jgi:hypothetical protein
LRARDGDTLLDRERCCRGRSSFLSGLFRFATEAGDFAERLPVLLSNLNHKGIRVNFAGFESFLKLVQSHQGDFAGVKLGVPAFIVFKGCHVLLFRLGVAQGI